MRRPARRSSREADGLHFPLLGTRYIAGGEVGKRFFSRRKRSSDRPLTRARVIPVGGSETRAATGSLPIVTGRKLMLVSGRANSAPARAIGHMVGIDRSHNTLKTFAVGEV